MSTQKARWPPGQIVNENSSSKSESETHSSSSSRAKEDTVRQLDKQNGVTRAAKRGSGRGKGSSSDSDRGSALTFDVATEIKFN